MKNSKINLPVPSTLFSIKNKKRKKKGKEKERIQYYSQPKSIPNLSDPRTLVSYTTQIRWWDATDSNYGAKIARSRRRRFSSEEQARSHAARFPSFTPPAPSCLSSRTRIEGALVRSLRHKRQIREHVCLVSFAPRINDRCQVFEEARRGERKEEGEKKTR